MSPVDNYQEISDRICKSTMLREAQRQVRNPFSYRPGFKEVCGPVAEKECRATAGYSIPSRPRNTALGGSGRSSSNDLPYKRARGAGPEGSQTNPSGGGNKKDRRQLMPADGKITRLVVPPGAPSGGSSALPAWQRRFWGQALARQHMTCLIDLPEARQTEKCSAEVTRMTKLSSQDIRLHPQLGRRCANEIQKFCSHLSPGNSRVLTCLKAELMEKQKEVMLSYAAADKSANQPGAMSRSAASSTGFNRLCMLAVSRIVVPQNALDTYKKFRQASGGNLDLSSKALQKIGLLKDGELSFLTLRGPFALLALLSLVFSSLTICYICYRRQKTAGYTSYVPDDASVGGLEADVIPPAAEVEKAVRKIAQE
ncbi:unnamed protein product [Amoebophrya sp. A25]|nr:unnamed protein product [Amoebophrya sp. A25]|eukprot:GSA25T00015391001.1